MRLRRSLTFVISVAVLCFDQLSKGWITHHLAIGQAIKITDWINVVHLRNEGALFGFLAEQSGWQNTMFLLLSLLIMGVLCFWLRTTPARDTLMLVAIQLVLGGASGNVVDRISLGAVVDFMDVHAYGWHWPAFNVADSAIVVGIFLMLWRNLSPLPVTQEHESHR